MPPYLLAASHGFALTPPLTSTNPLSFCMDLPIQTFHRNHKIPGFLCLTFLPCCIIHPYGSIYQDVIPLNGSMIFHCGDRAQVRLSLLSSVGGH